MNVAIFGAAGAIGPVAATELLRRGHRVRVVGRDASRLAGIAGAEPFAADLLQPEAAAAAAEGMDAILYTAGVPYDRFDLHPPMMRNALAAAKASGVRQFIHISNVYVYGLPQTPLVAETHPLAPNTRKGTFRLEQETLVVAAHDPNGLRTLALRPPDFFGPGVANSLADFVLNAALAGKTPDVLGPDDRPHEFIYVPDLAPVIADLFERPDAFGTAYNIAGSGEITTHDFVEALLRAAGRPTKTRVAGKNVLRLLGLFNPLMRELVEMNYLQSTPVMLDETKLRGVLPNLRKTSYAEGIAATVQRSLQRQASHQGATVGAGA